jgi:hypothetical protein
MPPRFSTRFSPKGSDSSRQLKEEKWVSSNWSYIVDLQHHGYLALRFDLDPERLDNLELAFWANWTVPRPVH